MSGNVPLWSFRLIVPQRLILGRRRHVAGHGKMRQKSLDLQLAHFGGVALAVEQNYNSQPIAASDIYPIRPNRCLPKEMATR